MMRERSLRPFAVHNQCKLISIFFFCCCCCCSPFENFFAAILGCCWLWLILKFRTVFHFFFSFHSLSLFFSHSLSPSSLGHTLLLNGSCYVDSLGTKIFAPKCYTMSSVYKSQKTTERIKKNKKNTLLCMSEWMNAKMTWKTLIQSYLMSIIKCIYRKNDALLWLKWERASEWASKRARRKRTKRATEHVRDRERAPTDFGQHRQCFKVNIISGWLTKCVSGSEKAREQWQNSVTINKRICHSLQQCVARTISK